MVQAKKEDMDRGMAQNILGYEAVADIESSSHLYGIVTNYIDWLFFRCLDDGIEQDSATLHVEDPGVTCHQGGSENNSRKGLWTTLTMAITWYELYHSVLFSVLFSLYNGM